MGRPPPHRIVRSFAAGGSPRPGAPKRRSARSPRLLGTAKVDLLAGGTTGPLACRNTSPESGIPARGPTFRMPSGRTRTTVLDCSGWWASCRSTAGGRRLTPVAANAPLGPSRSSRHEHPIPKRRRSSVRKKVTRRERTSTEGEPRPDRESRSRRCRSDPSLCQLGRRAL